MSISTTSIKRPVLAIVMNLILMLAGVIGYTFLGVREYPSIDPAVVSVRTSYPGANAEIIQSQITEPLEKSINSIDGIRNITSTSNIGTSNITIEFNLDKNLEEAANDVRDKVSQAGRQLPQDIDGLPVVSKADADSDPIISMTIQSSKRNILELSDYAENTIAQRLQTIPGVSSVQIQGQRKFAMRLWLDPSKLASFGLTPLDVRDALQQQNVELPSGKISGNSTELTVKTLGNMSTEEEFNNLIISSDSTTSVVKLSDVGYAVLGAENEETVLRSKGVPMVATAIIPQPGANYLEIAKEFYKRYDQLKTELPEDFVLDISLDNTLFIKKSVLEVVETLGIALILVIIVIYLFFRDWSIAFRPLIDIPVSLIATFFIMYMLGYSINVLTLLAIVLATGLVVDDGIVVTENIYKKVEEGMSPFEAAIKGSNEIFVAVISISVTLASVFLPLIFLEGFVGRLFREFGVVIGAAVLISAFVSLTLTPMLNAYLMKSGQKKSKFYDKTEPYFQRLNDGYKSALESFLNKRWLAFPILIFCFGLIYLFWNILPKETAPLDDRSEINVRLSTPEGSSFEYTDKVMQDLNTTLNDSIPELQTYIYITSPGFGGAGATNSGFFRIRLKQPNERERSQDQVSKQLTQIGRGINDARVTVLQRPTISVSRRTNQPIQYIIQANSFNQLQEKVPLFMDEVAKSPVFSVSDVDLKFNKPELNISIDREKADN
ncbi:MAG: efflux RND transporter permease subunit, partial [Pedobacter sp.]